MNLSRLSLLSIAGCLIGLAVLALVTVISAQQIREKQAATGEILELRERINDFSVASDNLVMFGADPGLLGAYLAEAEAIGQGLAAFGEHDAAARRAAHRVEAMAAFVASAVTDLRSHPGAAGESRPPSIAENPARFRIVQQRVASQGITLDTALNDLLRARQQSIAQGATRVVIILAGGALLFGALCVVAFGLIHRRVARPARAIAATLQRVQTGDPAARANVYGNDELSRLAETLNRALDERDAAETKLRRHGRLLDMAGRAAHFGAWSVDLRTEQVEWSDVVAEIHGKPPGYSPDIDEGMSFFAPEYRERMENAFRACVRRGEPFDEELQIINADEQRRWVRTVGEAVRDERGDIIRVQGAFQDLSERKTLELDSSRLADRMATMLEAITDGFVAFDEQWRYTYVNAQAERLLGKSSDELLGTTVWSQFPELAGTQSERALKRTMHERVSSSGEEYFKPLDAWFDMRTYPWEAGVAAHFRDVTQNHRMLEQLRAQEAALRASRDELDSALTTRQALINSLPAHIAMLDGEGVIVDVNDQWRHFGEQKAFSGSDFGVGTNYIALCETASGECAAESEVVSRGLRDVLEGRRETFALEYPCHSPDEKRWFRAMFNRLPADETGPNGAVAMHIDVTERKLAEEEINRLAYRDPLTDVLSRNGFVRSLGERLDNGGWPGEGLLAIIDVVNQHDINDAHGYDMGDRLLIALSRRIRELAGERGLTGRTGGDEFAIYYPIAPGEDVDAILEKLDQTVDQSFSLDGGNNAVEIDVKIGYTLLGEERRTTEDLIREAELALFEHRRDASTGMTQVAFTPELKDRTSQRIQLTHELRRALDAEEFELHFQPKVNLADGSIIGAEALIRWQHPERGLLSPGLFIPVAEQSQMIGPIGDWVLRAACRHLQEWQENELGAVRVSVNVSQVQFMIGDFSSKVQAALEEYDVDPANLSLEITESVFERHSDRLLTEIHELHKLGVKLSLDDFGTGYSSLLYLQRYPFDEIKIDQGFVNQLLDESFSHDIVRAVMSLAQALNADVVAEGIESREIAATLLDMGCRVGQGYYYSVPLEAEDFRWLLQRRSNLPLSPTRHRR